MGWVNPRWGSLVGPDADTLRGIFESLSEWTQNPTFGNATNPTIAGGGLVQVQPQAIVVKNEWVESGNYSPGVSGWRITAVGDAEFNSVTVRGVLRTAAPPNARVEIGTSVINRIDFYSGPGGETSPSSIGSAYSSNISWMDFFSGANASNRRAYFGINSGPATGGIGNFIISFTENNTAVDAAGDFHCFLNGGVGRFYGAGNSERFMVDNFGTVTTGTHEAGEAIMGTWTGGGGHAWFGHRDRWGAPELGLFQRSDGQVWIGSGTQTITFEHNGRTWIGEFNNDGFHCGQLATAKWNTHGPTQDVIRFTQGSGVGHTIVDLSGVGIRWWNGGAGYPYQENRNVGGANEWKVHGLPVIGGTILRIAGSAQIGPESSSIETKRNVSPLGGDNNPIWKITPKRFFWDESKVSNAAEINNRLKDLGGMAGLIAEDVAAYMPDGVHTDEEGKPVSLEHLTVQAYIVSGLQELKATIGGLTTRLAALEKKVK